MADFGCMKHLNRLTLLQIVAALVLALLLADRKSVV